MLRTAQRAALLALALLCGGAGACRTAADCELLGECVAGECKCDPGWAGPTCSQIKEGASSVVWPTPGGQETTASWGASMIPGKDGTTHMFNDVVCRKYTCAHTVSAQITHAVSHSGPGGPFHFREVAIPSELENVHALRAPSGEVLLYYGDHNYTFPNATCTGGAAGEAQHAGKVGGDPYPRRVRYMGIAYTADVDSSGGWQYHFPEYDQALQPLLPLINPSPMVLPNGSILLAFRYDPPQPTKVGETLGLAIADHWRGPYRLVTAAASPGEGCEDPFIFTNSRGYHMVYHCYRGNVSGCHSYSPDGLNWTVSPNAAYTMQVTWTNGTTREYDYRERPEILFEGGAPRHLLTGVEWGNKGADFPHCASFSIITEVLA
eukprot:TRINITY_DN4321_c0_g1_i1.p2 TRINITY_DN4321_c0_g1~~TRINITY_DN4321_c0_g1_i1.p2  ORF type:complete len:412 (+),score=119.94 TRINITY_DN4321_c0_g1_i1:105-1238(+)